MANSFEKRPSAFERPLAITDVETTGLDWTRHEIIDIGLLVVDQNTLAVREEFEIRVRPAKIETADPVSLRIAGYNEEEWMGAVPLAEAMRQYGNKVKNALFLAHPLTVDFSFIDAAFRKTGVENPLHYHQLDLFSMAWVLLKEEEHLPTVTLHELTKFFELDPEPTPHRAIGGARLALEILKKLRSL